MPTARTAQRYAHLVVRKRCVPRDFHHLSHRTRREQSVRPASGHTKGSSLSEDDSLISLVRSLLEVNTRSEGGTHIMRIVQRT